MSGIKSNGVLLSAIFAPYVAGTTKARVSGISDDAGELSDQFAKLSYGTAAAATGIESVNADLNTLYAAYGTTSYASPLSINGFSYSSVYSIPLYSTGFAVIGFRIVSGTTWQLYTSNPSTGFNLVTSGAVPAGSINVQYLWGSYAVGIGDLDAGGIVTNPAASPVIVSGNPSTYYTTDTKGSSSGSRNREYPFTINFFNGGGTNVSHTTCTLIGETDGSA